MHFQGLLDSAIYSILPYLSKYSDKQTWASEKSVHCYSSHSLYPRVTVLALCASYIVG